jgi:steroid delta-isomerase-like uncharacterized protein
MNKTTTLVLSLSVALGVTACKKKDEGNNAAPKATDNTATAPKPAEPPKPVETPKEAPKPMSGAELADLYKKCTSLLNDKKLDDFKKTCVADDYVSHMGKMDMHADQLVPMFQAMQTAFPDMKFEPQMILVNGRNVFGVALETGTHEGTLHMPPMPDMPATHKKFGMLFFHRLAMDDTNRAKEEWGFEDESTFMSQLGLSPKEAPPRRPAMDKGMEGAPIVVVAADDAKEKANLDVAKKGLDAFNAHKPADLVALVTDDVVESDQAMAKDATGKKEVEKGLKDFQTAFSDAKITPDNAFAAGDYVVTFGTFEGTNDHDLGKMKKTGKHVSLPMAEIMQFKDGKVSHLWRFYDSMSMAMQLGLVKMPGGDAPKTEGEAPKAPDKAPAKK